MLAKAVAVGSESKAKDQSRVIFAIMIGALAIRLLYLYLYQSLPDWDQLTVDNYYHHHWAQSIAGGNLLGDTTYFRAPLYIYMLSALYALLVESLWIGRLFGMVVGLATVFWTYRLGQRLFTTAVGLWAAAIYALMPTSLYFETELLLDPLFTLLCLVAVYGFIGWLKYQSTHELLTCGVLFGLAAITRPTMLIFLPVIFGYTFVASERSKRFRSLLMLAAGLAIIIGPIFARNIIVADDPVLISSQGGINFYLGNNEAADGITAAMPPPYGHNWRIEDSRYLAETESGRSLTPGEQSSFWFSKGIAWITENPTDFALNYLKKLYLFFSPDEFSNNRSLPAFFNQIWLLKYNLISFGLILPFAILGAIWSFHQDGRIRLIIWFVLLIAFTSALFFINSRFRLPLIPFLTILAAGGGYELINRYRQGVKTLLPALPVAAMVALALSLSLVPLSSTGSTQDLLSKGLKHINRKAYPQALSYLHAARRINASFPTTNLNLGICYFRMGQADSARFYFEQEQSYHPNRAKSYINLASLYLVNDQFDLALSKIARAIELKPYDRTAQLIRLRVLGYGGYEIDSLYRASLLAARATAYDIYVLNEALRQFMARREFGRAAQLVAEIDRPIKPPIETDDTAFDAIWSNSDDNYQTQLAEWHFNLGFIYGNLGEMELSINHSRQSIRLQPANPRAIQNLITALESAGRYDEADSVRLEAGNSRQ